MSVQIVEIAGQKMAMLPVADYERLLDIAEDKTDAATAVDAERRREEGEEYLPADMVDRILSGEGALRVWRNHRGLTLAALAGAAGLSIGFLSQIETGKRKGSMAIWRSLAQSLNVSTDDILPDG